MQRKYEIGDTVKIVKSKQNDFISFMCEMLIEDYIGKIGTIKDKIRKNTYIVLFENGDEVSFTEDMLVLEEKIERIIITKKGNTISANWNNKIGFNTENDDFKKGVNICLKELFKDINKQFKPHLAMKDTNETLGIIGEKTPLTALFGEELYIGDIIEYYSPITKLKGKSFVVKDNDGYYVMGYKGDINNLIDGFFYDSKVQFRKIKSYKELQHNEKINGVYAVLEEENEEVKK